MVSVLPQVARLEEIALNFFFPQTCLGCGKEGNFICRSCQSSLPRVMPPLCPLCGRPQSSGILCPSCVNWQAGIDSIRSPFRFEGTIREAVHQLKYRNLRALAVPLAGLLGDYVVVNHVTADVLVPVPLHRMRLRDRGYNQSALLARELGKLTKLPMVDNCLVRQRHSPPQARTLSVTERQSNVADAFICSDRRLHNKQVLLVDDVATSGATLNACAVALKRAGASSVQGLVLAREI